MKRRNRFFRMTSLILVFALMLSLLPTQALALGSYGEPPETVAFKVMRMDGVRTVAPISKYLYGTKENQFFRSTDLNYSGSWVQLTYVIEKSQQVSLELYKLEGTPPAGGTMLLNYTPDPKEDEDFLGERIGYLYGIRVTDNVVPLIPGGNIYTDPQVGWEDIDRDTWVRILNDAILTHTRPAEMMKDIYAFGYQGQQFDAAPASGTQSDTPAPNEDLPAGGGDGDQETAKAMPAMAQTEGEDLTGDPAVGPDTPDTPDPTEANPSAEPELPPKAEPSAEPEPVPSDEPAPEPSAEPDPEPTDVPDPEPAPSEFVPGDVGDVLGEESVFFTERGSDTNIQNFMLWDGSIVRDEGGSPEKYRFEDGYYVIVMTPTLEKNSVYNSFLAFQTVDSNSDADSFDGIDSHEELKEIRDELAMPGDPVDLLTGSFTWNYTDFALYGENDLKFTRFYESVKADKNYGLGNGWTSNFTYALEFGDLYAQVTLPQGTELFFGQDFDGSYTNCGDYSLEWAGGSYVMKDKAGNRYSFTPDGQIQYIAYVNGDAASFTYSGDKLTGVSSDTGSFTFTYNGSGNLASVTDSVGRTVTLSYEGDLLTAAENPDGDSLRYTYDGNGYLATVANFKGDIYVENTYDDAGRVIHQYAADFGTFDFTYHLQWRGRCDLQDRQGGPQDQLCAGRQWPDCGNHRRFGQFHPV